VVPTLKQCRDEIFAEQLEQSGRIEVFQGGRTVGVKQSKT
jgi:hypothetical protein